MTEEKLNEVSYKPLFFFFFLIILLWLFAWHFVGSSLNSWDERGAFGDMFGAINALFSGLAFAGVIFAILLQRKELELQRQELVQTRDELRGQKEALEQQNTVRDKQIFESTFFQLVRFQHDIVNSMDITKDSYDPSKAKLAGRDCFEYFYDKYSTNYYRKFDLEDNNYPKRINNSFESFFLEHQSDLGHYFRNLYNIFRFIDSSNYEWEILKFYANIIRGQISNYELLLLFYDGLWSRGFNFKTYIVKYALFDNMPLNNLIDQNHIPLYDKKAYGNQLG